MALTSPHWGLPYPEGSDNIAAGDNEIAALVAALDSVCMYETGLFVDRPDVATAKAGLIYLSTDVVGGRVDTFDGTQWMQVYPSPLYQTGDLKLSCVATEPAGWLKCDGRAVSRTTYAALYAALGGASSPYGQGDGSTTFNLPDYAGCTPVGTGTGTHSLTVRTLGQRFGEEGHSLSAAENGPHAHGVSDPSHAHSVYDPGHGHNISGGVPIYNTSYAGAGQPVAAAGSDYGLPRQALGADGAGTGIGIYGAYTGVAIQSQGSGSPHNTVQPSLGTTVLVKT